MHNGTALPNFLLLSKKENHTVIIVQAPEASFNFSSKHFIISLLTYQKLSET